MSYRDPKTIIQSTGKYYTQLSQSLAQTAGRYSETVAREAERRRQEAMRRSKISRDYQTQKGSLVNQEVRKGETTFGNVDYATFNNLVTQGAEIKSLDISSPEQNRLLQGVEGMPGEIRTTLGAVNTLVEGADQIIENTGLAGGLDAYAPQNTQTGYAMIAGAIPNKSMLTGRLNEDGSPEVIMQFTGKEGTYTLTGTELKGLIDNPEGQLGIVNPDLTEQRKNLWNNNILAQAADGSPSNKYRSSLMSEKQRSDYNKATGQTEFFKDPDVDKIKAVLYEDARATMMSLSNTEQISEFNRLGGDLKLKEFHMDYSKALSKDEVEELTKRYISNVIEEKMGPEPSDHSISTGRIAAVKPRQLTESDKKRILNAQESRERFDYVENKLQTALENKDVSIFSGEVIGSKKDRILEVAYSPNGSVITIRTDNEDAPDRIYDTNNNNDFARLFDDFAAIEYPKDVDQFKDLFRSKKETKIDPRIAKSNKSRSVQETVNPNAGKKQNKTKDFEGITSSGIRSGI